MAPAFLLLLAVPSVLAGWEDCKFSAGGHEYDFNRIAGTVIGHDAKVETYSYEMSLCWNNTNTCQDIMTGDEDYGAVYQYGGEPGGKPVCWDILAYWDGPNQGGITASPFVRGGDEGVTLSIQNGDFCKGAPRHTSINMICDWKYDPSNADPNKRFFLIGDQDVVDSCHFIFDYRTSAACTQSPSPAFQAHYAGTAMCNGNCGSPGAAEGLPAPRQRLEANPPPPPPSAVKFDMRFTKGCNDGLVSLADGTQFSLEELTCTTCTESNVFCSGDAADLALTMWDDKLSGLLFVKDGNGAFDRTLQMDGEKQASE